MTLSVDDEITLVEVAVILIGIAITWAVYRRARSEDPPPAPGSPRVEGPQPWTTDEDGKAAQ